MHSTEYNSNYELKLDRLQIAITLYSSLVQKQSLVEREKKNRNFSLMIFDLSANARLISRAVRRFDNSKWKCKKIDKVFRLSRFSLCN